MSQIIRGIKRIASWLRWTFGPTSIEIREMAKSPAQAFRDFGGFLEDGDL